MFNKNTLLSGIVLGILLPIVGFVLLNTLFQLLDKIGSGSGIGLSENFQERTAGILAIAINLLPMNLFKKRRWELAMRGVVIATGLLALIWVVYFGTKILQD